MNPIDLEERSYKPLSFFYFFYFGVIGALIPYWPLYLKTLGFNAAAIGELFAFMNLTRMVAPNLWGYLAGRGQSPIRLTRNAMGVGALIFLILIVVLNARTFSAMAVFMVVFTFFWNAAFQMETTVLNRFGTARYGRVRVWGSIGFIIVVVLAGPLLEQIGISGLPWILQGLCIGAWLSLVLAPEAPIHFNTQCNRISFTRIAVRPKVILLLIAGFLMQASHGPYYTFYSIHLIGQGYSPLLTSGLWALGVVSEIVVFWLIGRWLSSSNALTFLRLSFAFATLRWLIIATQTEHFFLLLFAQLLHAATFGTYHATAIHLIHTYFIEDHQIRGQALHASLCYGAGGAVGSLYAGYLWDAVGVVGTFEMAAILSALAWVMIGLFLKDKK